MSETNKPDVLSAYNLASPGWLTHSALEQELNERLAATLIRAAVIADPSSMARAMQAAAEIVSARPFGAMSDAYVNALAFDISLTPLLLWSCLQKNHPQISRIEAAKLVTEENIFIIRPVLLELLGLKLEKKEPPADPESDSPASNSTS